MVIDKLESGDEEEGDTSGDRAVSCTGMTEAGSDLGLD